MMMMQLIMTMKVVIEVMRVVAAVAVSVRG